MKLLPVILCCLFITLKYERVDGQNLLQGFFEKVHDNGQKVRTDLHKFAEKTKSDLQKLFQPRAGRKNENSANDVDKVKSQTDSSTTSSTISSPNKKENIIFPTEEPAVKPTEGPIVFPTEESTLKSTEKPIVVSTTKRATDDSDKDGKENFSGGCLPGFMRTSDGRCMPTY